MICRMRLASCARVSSSSGAAKPKSAKTLPELWVTLMPACRGNGLLVSFHAYNNEADVDLVVEALRAEAALLERADASREPVSSGAEA